MAQNERLRAALIASGLSLDELAQAAEVDEKTVERWVTGGRTPHRSNATRAARALGREAAYLWPGIEQGHRQQAATQDLVAVYATRKDAPLDLWRSVFEQANQRIGILAYSAVYLHELWPTPGLNRLLTDKATTGCQVTVLIGDPDSPAVALRGQEEHYGHGIEARCYQAFLHYSPLIGTEGVEIRQHGTTLYNSIYIGDDTMLVNVHRYGMNAYAAPVLHLHRRSEGGMFDGYADSFDQVRRVSRLVPKE
jgi:transcriptional regulator with XRE-family HTH domain